MAGKTRLITLSEEGDTTATPTIATAPTTASPPSEASDRAQVSAVEFLSLLLSVLSQRTVAALGHVFPIIVLASGFALWWRILPDPSDHQLIGVGLYAIFMLLILVVKRR